MVQSKFLTLAVCLLLASGSVCSAQRFSIGTNAVEWANLGTVNAEAGVAVARHISLHAGVRYNPWTFLPGNPDDRVLDPIGDSEKQFQNRKQSYNLTLRYWPWYVYSGWWFGLKAQYSEYDYGGFITHPREAGDKYGGGVSAGYTYMLSPHWNVEFGAGVWAGYKVYGTYRCTNCGKPTGSGQGVFFMPDDVMLSIMFVF